MLRRILFASGMLSLACFSPSFSQQVINVPLEVTGTGNNTIKLDSYDTQSGTYTPTPDGFYMTDSSQFASCPHQAGTSCASAANIAANNELYSLLLRHTKRYYNRNEWPMMIDAYSSIGQAQLWKPSTIYAVNQTVVANGNTYIATSAGTSGSNGSGPSGTGTGISDNTVVWSYTCGANACNGTYLPFNSSVIADRGGASTWAGDFNIVIQPGAAAPIFRGVEVDLTNQSVACGAAMQALYDSTNSTNLASSCYDLWLQAHGTAESTASIEIDSDVTTNTFGWKYGILIGAGYGKNNNSELADIFDQSSGQVGVDVNGGSHSIAAIRDVTNGGLDALILSGSKQNDEINVSGSATTGQYMHGSFGANVYDDVSVAPVGMQLTGSYSDAAIAINNNSVPTAMMMGTGQRVCWANSNWCITYDGNGMVFTGGDGTRLASLDSSGNWTTKGDQTPHTSP